MIFLKEKRDVRVKGRACANGRKQRTYTNKEDATSLPVFTEAIVLTALIEAYEERYVACFEVPGAYLHAEIDEDVTMVLEGTLEERMDKIDPSL